MVARNPIILLLLALAAGNAIMLVWILRRSRVKEPACGGCGYAVRGLESIRCPECGGELERLGILTPRMVPALPPWMLAVVAVVILTALMPLPAQLVLSLRDVIDPPVMRTTETVTLGGRGLPAITINHVELPESRSFTVTTAAAADGVTFASPDDRALGDWLDAAGLAAIRSDFAQVLRNRVAGGGWSTSSPFNAVSMNSTAAMMPRTAWVKTALDATVLVIWLGGIVLIVLRARRRTLRSRVPA